MKNDPNLEFLRSRIESTRTALCTMYHPGFLNTSYIVQTNSVDDEGNILFSLIDSKTRTVFKNEDPFRLKLFYYKKGLGYFLTIEASARFTALKDSKSSPENNEVNTSAELLGIKAKILSAEYSEDKKSKLAGQPRLMDSFKKTLNQIAALWL